MKRNTLEDKMYNVKEMNYRPAQILDPIEIMKLAPHRSMHSPYVQKDLFFFFNKSSQY